MELTWSSWDIQKLSDCWLVSWLHTECSDGQDHNVRHLPFCGFKQVYCTLSQSGEFWKFSGLAFLIRSWYSSVCLRSQSTVISLSTSTFPLSGVSYLSVCALRVELRKSWRLRAWSQSRPSSAFARNTGSHAACKMEAPRSRAGLQPLPYTVCSHLGHSKPDLSIQQWER